MVFGRVGHIVGHDVHKVHITQAAVEVDVPGIGHGGGGEQFFLAQRLAQVAHEQGVVVGVVGRRGDAGHAAGGVFPVDVDAVESVLVYHAAAVFGKGAAVLGRGGHLAEVAAGPSAHGEHHLQLGVLLLQCHHFFQEVGVLYVYTVEGLLHMSEGIVDVGHQGGVGQPASGPRGHIGHHDFVGTGLAGHPCKEQCQQCQQGCSFLSHAVGFRCVLIILKVIMPQK